MHLLLSIKAGCFFTKTFVLPPSQGVMTLGMQGIFCNLPLAAAVAAATTGFAKDLHKPKGFMFTMGLLSIMLAMGLLPKSTGFTG
jgi:hypothetical protein